MTPAEVREVAKGALTTRQYDAWKLVEWEGRSKRQSARILGIHRKTLDGRLNQSYAKLSVLVGSYDWGRGSGSCPLAFALPQGRDGRGSSGSGATGGPGGTG